MTVHYYAKKYNAFISELLNDRERCRQEHSLVDKQITDILHFLELEKVNAVLLAKANKKLRELTMKRRKIKDNIADIDRVLGKFKNLNIMNEECEPKYTYRTDVIDEIFSSLS